MKLLLHTCCAPCSVYCVKTLAQEGIKPTLYWYNPNIHPFSEYNARKECLEDFAKMKELDLVVDDEYGLDDFVCNVSSDKGNLKVRCEEYCYPKRLGRVFEYAKKNGYDAVSTTLLYSIYQKHEIIVKLMEFFSEKYGIEFVYRDFREGWREGQDEARRLGLYMQKYCGCVYSEEESTFARKNKKLFKELDLKPTNANARELMDRMKKGN